MTCDTSNSVWGAGLSGNRDFVSSGSHSAAVRVVRGPQHVGVRRPDRSGVRVGVGKVVDGEPVLQDTSQMSLPK